MLALAERHDSRGHWLCAELDCPLQARAVRLLLAWDEAGARHPFAAVFCRVHGELWGGALVDPREWRTVLRSWLPD